MLTFKRTVFVLILLGLSTVVQAEEKTKTQNQMARKPAAVEPAKAELTAARTADVASKSMNDDQMLVELQATLESEDFASESAEP